MQFDFELPLDLLKFCLRCSFLSQLLLRGLLRRAQRRHFLLQDGNVLLSLGNSILRPLCAPLQLRVFARVGSSAPLLVVECLLRRSNLLLQVANALGLMRDLGAEIALPLCRCAALTRNGNDGTLCRPGRGSGREVRGLGKCRRRADSRGRSCGVAAALGVSQRGGFHSVDALVERVDDAVKPCDFFRRVVFDRREFLKRIIGQAGNALQCVGLGRKHPPQHALGVGRRVGLHLRRLAFAALLSCRLAADLGHDLLQHGTDLRDGLVSVGRRRQDQPRGVDASALQDGWRNAGKCQLTSGQLNDSRFAEIGVRITRVGHVRTVCGRVRVRVRVRVTACVVQLFHFELKLSDPTLKCVSLLRAFLQSFLGRAAGLLSLVVGAKLLLLRLLRGAVVLVERGVELLLQVTLISNELLQLGHRRLVKRVVQRRPPAAPTLMRRR
mmetsp:Transcript_53271/g.163882  ORF Transcript_53271/g.163882 Transcript_53271/m.163882 type:complete len:440 (-) Transcript_53271:580-1899(-)